MYFIVETVLKDGNRGIIDEGEYEPVIKSRKIGKNA